MAMMSDTPSAKEVRDASLRMSSGMSSREWAWLFRIDELRDNIYIIDDNPVTARHVDEFDNLPWTLLLLLGCHSRKHIFIRRRALPLQQYHQAATDMINRLKWAWHFRNTAKGPFVKKLRNRSVCSYNGEKPPPGLNTFANNLRHAVHEAVVRVNHTLHRLQSNMAGYVKHAFRFVKQQRLHIVQSDKDGVFCVIPHELHLRMQASQLSTKAYHRVSWTALEVALEHSKRLAGRITDKLRRLGDDPNLSAWPLKCWASECSRAADTADPRLCVAHVRQTCKTHKGPGEVTYRTIHACSNLNTSCISAVVCRLLREHIKCIPHLCFSSADVIKKISSVRLPLGVAFTKLDIKDFFMDGEHSVLIRGAAKLMPLGRLRDWTIEALEFLLSSQYVTTDDDQCFGLAQ